MENMILATVLFCIYFSVACCILSCPEQATDQLQKSGSRVKGKRNRQRTCTPHSSKAPSLQDYAKAFATEPEVEFQGQSSPIACCLEDCPQSSLRGQAYEFASPFEAANNLATMTIRQLKQLAAIHNKTNPDAKIKGFSRLTKAQLVNALSTV